MAVDGKVAFITGGGRGIGKALALGFGREGYEVVIASTTAGRNEAVADLVRESGGEALPVEVDVTREEDVKRAVAQTLDRFGRIDVLINNAGLKQGAIPSEQRLLKDLSLSPWRRMLDVNVTGPFLCARECAGPMIAQGGGCIINISSGAGSSGREGNGPYAASKAALNMITTVLALELREHNISANALLPGFTAVEGTRLDRANPGRGPAPVRPETCGPVCLFLAAQDPIQVTGEFINVLRWNEEHGFGGQDVWSALA